MKTLYIEKHDENDGLEIVGKFEIDESTATVFTLSKELHKYSGEHSRDMLAVSSNMEDINLHLPLLGYGMNDVTVYSKEYNVTWSL